MADAPGWRRFRIVPTPGGGLTSAEATLETPHGRAGSAWRIENGRMKLTVRIPPNTRADVELPVATGRGVTLDGEALRRPGRTGGRTVVRLPSGEYSFDLPAPGR
jgi:alpha-L-rhamnosidase